MLVEVDVAEHPAFGAVAAVVWARRGRVEEAARLAAIAAADPNRAPVERVAPAMCLSARAEVALAQGHWTELRETVGRAFAAVPAKVRGAYPDLRPFVLYGLQAEAELAFEARIRRDADAETAALGMPATSPLGPGTCPRVTDAGEPLAAATLADAALAEALLTRVEHRPDPDAWTARSSAARPSATRTTSPGPATGWPRPSSTPVELDPKARPSSPWRWPRQPSSARCSWSGRYATSPDGHAWILA